MGVQYFPLSIVSALVFTFLFTDITYNSIHSSNDTIQKSESHWTFMIEFSKETDMENNLWAG